MRNALDLLLFGIYPYVALTIFFVVSFVRFEREQYSWKSDSSQLLRAGQLRVGNICFHAGILGLFLGHLFGLLTPLEVWAALGITHRFKQEAAMVVGGILGLVTLTGLLILIHRRLSDARIRAHTRTSDWLLLFWILATLLLGLSTIISSSQHLDGDEMVSLIRWAQHIVTLRPWGAMYLAHVPWIFKLHIFMGMTLFVIFPFTRLVHIWSGFASSTYLLRAWQLVRPR